MDNETAFRSHPMIAFFQEWKVEQRFRGAYRPEGNGVVERVHRTVKVIVARSRCSVLEAVAKYNRTPKDGVSAGTAPIRVLHNYEASLEVPVTPAEMARFYDKLINKMDNNFNIGDYMWVKDPNGRCGSPFRKGGRHQSHIAPNSGNRRNASSC